MAVIRIAFGLPFISVTLRANDQQLVLENVLLDTGSAANVFKTDDLRLIGVIPTLTDKIRFMSGIGGRESVVEKQIQEVQVEELSAKLFNIQLGALDYDFPMDGILGMEFLHYTGAIINFHALTIASI